MCMILSRFAHHLTHTLKVWTNINTKIQFDEDLCLFVFSSHAKVAWVGKVLTIFQLWLYDGAGVNRRKKSENGGKFFLEILLF